jgi:hypothetical protein
MDVQNKLNEYNDWVVPKVSDDGRINSQNAERQMVKKINNILNITKTKSYNREEKDLYINDWGEDLKIVEPENFTNTISFRKLAKMLNLKGGNFDSIAKSYRKNKEKNQLKLVSDYVIIFYNKKTKKFTISSLTELPEECIMVNPSNCVQTKIPTTKINRTDYEKFELVHKLFIEYIDKRVLNPAKEWEFLINGK